MTGKIHGIIGLLVLIGAEILMLKKIEPFATWFYSFAWWSYILIVDSIIYKKKGNSLIVSRTASFLIMIPWIPVLCGGVLSDVRVHIPVPAQARLGNRRPQSFSEAQDPFVGNPLCSIAYCGF